MSQYLRIMYKCLCDVEEIDQLTDHDFCERLEMETVIRDNRRLISSFEDSFQEV